MAKANLSSYFKAKSTVGAEEVVVEVKRLTVAQFIAFEEQFLAIATPAGEAVTNVVAEAKKVVDWIRETFDAYVRVPAGEIAIDGDERALGGVELFDVIGGRLEDSVDVLTQIYMHNRVGDALAKKLNSPSGSPATSGEQATAAAGPRPEPTAESAAAPGFVLGGVVAPDTTAPSSGATSSSDGETR